MLRKSFKIIVNRYFSVAIGKSVNSHINHEPILVFFHPSYCVSLKRKLLLFAKNQE